MGDGTPYRYLLAHTGPGSPHMSPAVLLRFPPGVVLEDDMASADMHLSIVRLRSRDTLRLLEGLGVSVVDEGPRAEIAQILCRAARASADFGAYIRDYLGTNARLGPLKCVSVEDYAMYTFDWSGRAPLRPLLLDALAADPTVSLRAGVAFRKADAPDGLHLRIGTLARAAAVSDIRSVIPCRLHGRPCAVRAPDWWMLGDLAADTFSRVPVSPDELSLLHSARSWDARALARRVLDAADFGDRRLWSARGGQHLPLAATTLARAAAYAHADSCEEYGMLSAALAACESAREMARRAREADPAWAVSRALEAMS